MEKHVHCHILHCPSSFWEALLSSLTGVPAPPAMPVLQLQAAEAAVAAGEQHSAQQLTQRSATEPLKTALKPTDARRQPLRRLGSKNRSW